MSTTERMVRITTLLDLLEKDPTRIDVRSTAGWLLAEMVAEARESWDRGYDRGAGDMRALLLEKVERTKVNELNEEA